MRKRPEVGAQSALGQGDERGPPMNFLILGDGPEELAWARALVVHEEHRLGAAYPGFKMMPDLPGSLDMDEALATADIDAAIVGGGPELRAEGLRRVAAVGLPAICLHPPGPNADPYYQVALSRQETGAILVPDLPARLYPGVAAIDSALRQQTLGACREIRFEMPSGPVDGSLLGDVLPRVIDVVRALIGEVASVLASGDREAEPPTGSLLVLLRGARVPNAEIRLWAGPPVPARLSLVAEHGMLTLEFDPTFDGPARLINRNSAAGLDSSSEHVEELEPWDPKVAILEILEEAVAGREVHPDLLDGTRAMELAEAAARALRKGKTIDLHYEEVSELSNFKAVMTSTGCAILLGGLVMLPVALIGPAFGLVWTIYVAYAIPPLLLLFLLLQLLRFAVRKG